MSLRLLIQGGGGSPMRVFAEGANPSTATFADLLFDANYRGMRQSQLTIFSCPLPAAPQNTVTWQPLAKTFSSPPAAVGMVHWTQASSGGVQRPQMMWRTINNAPNPAGACIGTDVNQMFCEHWYANTIYTSLTAAVLVFDFPMAG